MSALTDAYTAIWDGQLGCYDAHTVTINSVVYACDGGELSLTDKLDDGGIMQLPDAQVAIKRSLIGTMPKRGDAATYRSKSMRVDSVATTPDDTVVIISLTENR